jgi:hypothetical protein
MSLSASGSRAPPPFEKRLTGVIVGELLVDHLPADRVAVLRRRECVAEPRAAWPEPAHRTELLTPVGMMQANPIARLLGERPGQLSVFRRLVDALDEPEPPSQPKDVTRLERLLRRVLVDALAAARRHSHDVVLE